jgi:ribosomal protein S12 methylthiotransferase
VPSAPATPLTLAPGPRIGMVSLGCPKALVDSERILSKLRADGYRMSADYAGADVVLVNTCGFLDSAKAESLAAIGEAIAANGRVIVTGCLGHEADMIRSLHPKVLAVTGPQQYDAVVGAVHAAAPTVPSPYLDLAAVQLTPPHFAYLKISEGCNHRCKFCIIPSLRGDLSSRPANAVVREAELMVARGVRELLVVSQDTSAYGVDIGHAVSVLRDMPIRAHITDLSRALGQTGAWVRLHYVYPYPHVDALMPLMAEGLVLPYLDIPFQHASPSVLKAMARPANEAKVLERIAKWRAIVPDLALRSTFIVGFPGETEADFTYLLEWLAVAQIDRAGCFKYEAVAGAAANALPGVVPEDVKDDRWHRFMAAQAAISEARLAAKVGRTLDVIIDAVDDASEGGDGGASGRSKYDAPEIDGEVHLRDAGGIAVGDIVRVTIEDADEVDLFGVPA